MIMERAQVLIQIVNRTHVRVLPLLLARLQRLIVRIFLSVRAVRSWRLRRRRWDLPVHMRPPYAHTRAKALVGLCPDRLMSSRSAMREA